MPVPRTWGSQARRRGGPGPTMRVSDADRAEVADRLAQHYGDGRLDQAELDERLGRAMSAKTQADLSGLFDDLPDIERPAGPVRPRASAPVRPRPRRPRHLLPIVLIVVITIVAWHSLAGWLVPWPLGFWLLGGPWLWIALLAFLWLRYGPRRRH
jgi:hypothetical protein